jgi:hypothetical protein
MSITRYLTLPARDVQSTSFVGCSDGDDATGPKAKTTDKPIAMAATGITINTRLFLFEPDTDS